MAVSTERSESPVAEIQCTPEVSHYYVHACQIACIADAFVCRRDRRDIAHVNDTCPVSQLT